MKIPRPRPMLLALSLIATLATLISCGGNSSNNNGVTNPTPKELDSGDIAPGGTWPHTFTAASGTFNYHCVHHPMSGSVTIGGSAMAVAVTIGPGSAFSPSSVQVASGGTVTWTNSPTSAVHTVTSD